MNQKKHLMVFPLKAELTPFLERLKKQFSIQKCSLSQRLTIYKIENSDWFFSTCGLGKPQSALQTQHLIETLGEVSNVYCAGAAGSLDPKVPPQDIVFATSTIEHDHKEGFKKNSPLPEFFNDKVLIEFIRANPNHEAKIHFNKVASGDEDIVSSQRAQEISEQTQAVAVAWEGAGVARACRFNHVKFNEVRIITDFADDSAPEDFKKNLDQSMKILADLFITFINTN